ncbi:LEAF RUST 10 DISEASE-RESISTANCE LOCUS RECEPTOR-LIKE PROTEIN KINASE-like protein 1.2 isoform X6 [Cinnamomum micranthum f. kanehirae]|uniref:LEAF RUST 10 DISEASE-RESISTANCE LOCUS RECEPTOR-LIKE PROTEIN KINASE-like protein 1.2 isoform X6 n=1 Tax=Cinnamomum micranthum f. kanehirae TaxID=337451 RepID=A0A3S3MYN6_9MAGN|nr:LEAF RUST 10 DISEASE-RESISTANCE LOCUS RECEPTOR-LIKE PROTEIN KINASE-like protein 1.2 isoform X6 [Cinnamomum micranthum f. kanehirae]
MMNTFPIQYQSLPKSFILLVLLFFMPASASSSTGEVNQPHSDCSPLLFQCGKVQHNISYPFWTKGYPEHCSYEIFFEIKCNPEDNSSEIVIQSHKYHVKEINYENQIVTIVDEDYFDHGRDNSCLRPSRNTTFDSKLLDYYFRRDRIEGDGMLLFLYNCSHNPSEDHLNPFIKSLKCLSVSHQSSSPTFYASKWFIEEEGLMGWGGCQVIEIPILQRNMHRLLFNPDAWTDVLREGFEVKWSAIDPDHRCWNCVRSNGHCGYNADSPTSPTCYCKGKPHLYTCPSGPTY